MKKISLSIYISLILLIFIFHYSPTPYAHHSYAVYDILDRVAIEGEVVSYRYGRPHPILVLQETLDSGEAVEWTIEGVSIMMWTRRNLPQDIATPGETMTVYGWPARDGRPKMLLSSVTRETGEEILLLDEVRQREAREAAGLPSAGRRHPR